MKLPCNDDSGYFSSVIVNKRKMAANVKRSLIDQLLQRLKSLLVFSFCLFETLSQKQHSPLKMICFHIKYFDQIH